MSYSKNPITTFMWDELLLYYYCIIIVLSLYYYCIIIVFNLQKNIKRKLIRNCFKSQSGAVMPILQSKLIYIGLDMLGSLQFNVYLIYFRISVTTTSVPIWPLVTTKTSTNLYSSSCLFSWQHLLLQFSYQNQLLFTRKPLFYKDLRVFLSYKKSIIFH